MEKFLPLATLCILIVGQLYWLISERKSEKAKPLKQSRTSISYFKRFIIGIIDLFIVLQLISFVSFLPLPQIPFLSLFGFCLVCIGALISVQARRDLGNNWAHAVDYQIKTNHELVTQGIYRFIRHPIYIGLLFGYVGAELVIHSYIAIIFFIAGGCLAYLQAKREEKLLSNYFGEKYKKYMKHSKMFIPYFF